MYTQEQEKQNYRLMLSELRKLVAEAINAVPDELRICNRIKPQGIYLKDGKIVIATGKRVDGYTAGKFYDAFCDTLDSINREVVEELILQLQNPNRKKKADGTLYKTYYTYRCNYKDGIKGHRCNFTTQPSEVKINEAVKEVVLKLVSNPNFAEKIKKLIDAKVDVTDINNECIQLEAQLKQYTIKKDKLAIQLDELDILDDFYETKAQDLQKRIDVMYQKMSETKRALEKAEEKRDRALKDKITGEKVYQYLMVFGKIIDKCTDGEKKKIYNLLIDEVQIFDCEQEDGRWLKSIKFRFPIYYNNDLIDSICWSENPSVETVCLLSKKP